MFIYLNGDNINSDDDDDDNDDKQYRFNIYLDLVVFLKVFYVLFFNEVDVNNFIFIDKGIKIEIK